MSRSDRGDFIRVFGIVKDDKHKTRALLNTNREEIKVSDAIFKFITSLQDEVHNVAIQYHKKLRDKKVKKSKLDNIKGIGPKKKQALLKHFGSMDNIAIANIQEVAKVAKISEHMAINLLTEIRN